MSTKVYIMKAILSKVLKAAGIITLVFFVVGLLFVGAGLHTGAEGIILVQVGLEIILHSFFVFMVLFALSQAVN